MINSDIQALKIENNKLKHKNADLEKQNATLETRIIDLEVQVFQLQEACKTFEIMWEEQKAINGAQDAKISELIQILKHNNLMN